MISIDLQNYQMVGSGAFAEIWADAKKEKVLKLFKSYNHPNLDGTGKEEWGEEKTNQYRMQVFSIELDAYQMAQKSEVLKKHTPTFYGQAKYDAVIKGEENVTHQYLKDCCLELEYVPGDCVDLDAIMSDDQFRHNLENALNFNLQNIISEFDKVGIKYILDSAIIYNSKSFVVIDFATIDPFAFELKIGES